MRVERPTQPYPSNLIGKQSDSPQSTTFSQVLNKKTQDTYVSTAKTTLATEISSSDSTEMKMAKLAAQAAEADYTGMSYEEIYTSIWNRYNKAFDGNMAAITGNVGGPASWCKVNNQFHKEVSQNVTGPMQREIWLANGASSKDLSAQTEAFGALRTFRVKLLGYEGMSFDEMESAIQKKYAGQESTVAYLNMQGELSITGCLRNKLGEKGASTYQTMLNFQFETTYNPNNPYRNNFGEGAAWMSDAQWQSIANRPFDSKKLASSMEEMLKGMTFDGPQAYQDSIKAIILSAIERFALKNI